jgi:tetratricopeptide (TPR) repeat protein
MRDALNEKTIRQLLRDWNSLKTLGTRPLASWGIVEARHQAAGYSPTAAGRGLALREVLQAALETLKPDSGPPDPEENRWRPYLVLFEQYVQGRSPSWVQEQLFLSKGAYYDAQKRALEMVADVLWAWEEKHQCHQAEDDTDHPKHIYTQAVTKVPFLAPPRPAYNLVGRDDLLHDLKQRVINGEDRALVALNGLPGVGKTSIAIELAHAPEILNHFEDGVLWAGLGRQPDLLALLGAWAVAVGVPAEVIARRSTVAERAALVHATIGLRRMLLIIDDAWQTEAALSLKVGGPNCAHLVTTRLAKVALDFASGKVTTVRELELDDGLDLLAQLSPRAVAEEPDEARALVQSVGGLPLALVLMGGYLRKQGYDAQSRRMREALIRLQATETRLQLTQPQPTLEPRPDLPPNTPLSLQAVIGLSDTALDATAHRALVNLSLFAPKPNTFSEEAALAVIAAPAEVLDTLVDHGLVESVAPDRYTPKPLSKATPWYFRGLVKSVAPDRYTTRPLSEATPYGLVKSVAPDRYTPKTSSEATLRYLQGMAKKVIPDHYAPRTLPETTPYYLRHVKSVAPDRYALHQTIADYASLQVADPAAAERLVSHFAQYVDAYAADYQTLDWEIINILTALETAFKAGQHDKLIRMVNALYTFLETRGLYEISEQHLHRAHTVAEAIGDVDSQATILNMLGDLEIRRGRFKSAQAFLQQSIDLARATQCRRLEADRLFQLGLALSYMGDRREGRAALEQALLIERELGNRQGEGYALCALGLVLEGLCDYGQAIDHLEQALRVCRESGNRRGEGWTHYNFCMVYLPMGDFARAQAHAEQSQPIFRELGDWRSEGWLIFQFGRLFRQLGRYDEARASFAQALQILNEIRDRMGQGFAIHNLGLVASEIGDDAAAVAYFEQALPIFQKIECRVGESCVYYSLGVRLRRLGDYAGAKSYLERALQINRTPNSIRADSKTLANLGLVCLHLGDNQTALEYGQQAASLAQQIGASPTQAYALTFLGHILVSLGHLDEAASIYRQAIGLRRELGQPHWVLDPLAGLAHVFLRQRNLPQARSAVEEILDYLEARSSSTGSGYGLAGIDSPGEVYMTCYRVLQAGYDHRHKAVLHAGKYVLQERAAKISDEEQRRSFWENVPAHRGIIEAVEQALPTDWKTNIASPPHRWS